MNPFIKSMILRALIAFIVIGIGAWGGILIGFKRWNFFIVGVLFLALGAIGTLILAQDFTNLWKASVTKRLDGYAISVLSTMNGLSFTERQLKPLDSKRAYNNIEVAEYQRANLQLSLQFSALRYLNNLGLIECDMYPSVPTSWSYHLTPLGRHLVTEKLNNKRIYPKIFCDLMRTRYWIDYEQEFNKRKFIYFLKYFVTWDRAWNELKIRFKHLFPNEKRGPLPVFLEYVNSPENNFDTVMQELVNPWLEQIKK